MTVVSSLLLHNDSVGDGVSSQTVMLEIEPPELLINRTEQQGEEAVFSCREVSYTTAFACSYMWLHPLLKGLQEDHNKGTS